nr:MAG TPA: hypothetical protein [Caudoviricetes sp.]
MVGDTLSIALDNFKVNNLVVVAYKNIERR